jgi:hypothetical protein
VSSGGFVNNKRVNGQLAVSRALGDVEYKKPKKLVSASPELSEIRLQDGDEFLIIACDGLWDVLSSKEAVAFVRDRLKGSGASSGGGDSYVNAPRLNAIANELVKHAIDEKKSSDNVSVLIAKVVTPEMDGGLYQSSGLDLTPTKAPPAGTPSPKRNELPFAGLSFDDDDDFDAPSTKPVIVSKEPVKSKIPSSNPAPPLKVKGSV